MIDSVRRALRFIDSWTKKRLVVVGVLALFLTLLETGAFALIYLVLAELNKPGSVPHLDYPWLFGPLVEGTRNGELIQLGVLAMAIFLTKSVASAAAVRWQMWVMNACEGRLASSLFERYLQQDYLAHVHRNSAVLMRNLTSSVGLMTTQVVGGLATLLTEGALLLGILITLVLVNPVVTVVLAAYFVLVSVGYLSIVAARVRRAAEADQNLTESTMLVQQEGFRGIKTVKAYNASAALASKHRDLRMDLAVSRATLAFAGRLPQYYLEICLIVGLAVGAFALSAGSGGPAYLALLVGAALRALPSANRLLATTNAMRAARSAVDRIEDAQLDFEPHSLVSPPREPLPFSGSITFKDVSFSYPGATEPALENIDLRILAGTAVGIVGQSGAGKSTLVDLILALLAPSSGSITVDGRPLDERSQTSWRDSVGYVPQETFLLDDSIRGNVLFHRSSTDAAVWKALERAHLADMVMASAERLDTSVAEGGARLSGGQRQRVGIARALLTDPAVLVFDEATSALDGGTEAAIASTIANLSGETTSIIIAHRLSTVRHCDLIILLRDGRIEARGTFDELMSSSIEFARMARLATVSGQAEVDRR
jgi:ABC-type multidrug transport system fused ATPase/permease subunit